MIKLSEALKIYEDKKSFDEVEQYFSETQIYKKIDDIKMLIRILGDVEFESDSLKSFLYKVSTMKIGKFGISEKDAYKEIKTIYDLIKDAKLSSHLICTLFDYYKLGAYELFQDDLKQYIDSCESIGEKSLSQMLKEIVLKATIIAKGDALRLEEFKGEYDSEFITKIQEIVKDRIIPFDKVVSILPSKELIDSSTVEVPYFGYTIISGKDLVERRLKGYISDDDIEQTDMDDCIKLGICSTGEFVYTSFTKKEYLESLKFQKSKALTKRKK